MGLSLFRFWYLRLRPSQTGLSRRLHNQARASLCLHKRAARRLLRERIARRCKAQRARKNASSCKLARSITGWSGVRVPVGPPKNSASFTCRIFYPSRRLGISSRHSRVYHQRRHAAFAYHHASACIPLRLDDIQPCELMICNFFEIDNMQGLRLDVF